MKAKDKKVEETLNYVYLHRFLKNRISKLQKKAKENHAKTVELQQRLANARSQLHKLVMNMIENSESFEKSIDQILKSYET